MYARRQFHAWPIRRTVKVRVSPWPFMAMIVPSERLAPHVAALYDSDNDPDRVAGSHFRQVLP